MHTAERVRPVTDERTLFPALTFLTGKPVLEVCYKGVHVLTSEPRTDSEFQSFIFFLKYLTRQHDSNSFCWQSLRQDVLFCDLTERPQTVECRLELAEPRRCC